MTREDRTDPRRIITQIAAIDPLVAIEVSMLADVQSRFERGDHQIGKKLAGTNAYIVDDQHFLALAYGMTAADSVATQPNKIALIGIYGGLTPRGSYYGSSLSGIASSATRAAADPDVAGIIVDVDSPGGTVSATAEAAAAIADAATKKPVVAVVNTLAASAAYWIASQASELVISPSGDVGSIGAMIMHQDISGYLDQIGLKMTIIRSEQSPMKNEAHPFAALSDDAKAFLQGRANAAGAEFIKAVASGRRVTQAKVKDDFGQGRMFGARDALARGMADRVATLDQVIGAMVSKMPTRAAGPRRRSTLAFE